MDLPAPIKEFMEGGIDPYSQTRAEAYAQYFLAALVVVGFLGSYFTSSVLVGLEVFLAGFLLMIFTLVPPWPFLNKNKVKFLPVRPAVKSKEKKDE